MVSYAEKSYDQMCLMVARETEYGEDAGPTAAANAILAMNVKIAPMVQEMIERAYYKPFWGRRPQLATGRHLTIDYEIELAGAGTAGTAPAYDAILRMGAWARTLVTGTATIAAAAVPATDAVGRFTFARTTKYAGLYRRTATLTCTTGGGSGVAAFTVTAASTPADSAYNQTAVVMTTASPFALPNGAVITPSAIGTDFETGDVLTIALTPERAAYTPVSAAVESCTQLLNMDGTLHKGLGCRASVSLKVSASTFPVLMVKSFGLFVPVTGASLPTDADYSGFKDPEESNPDTVPAFLIDGYEPAFSELSIDTGTKVGHRQVVNKAAIRSSGRDATGQLTIDEPPIGEKDFYALAEDSTHRSTLWLRQGTVAGSIIDIEAPAVQVDGVEKSDDDNVTQLQMKLGFLPVAGNDELTLSIG
ncbi:hypothetical protein HL658_10025 [Azospirillum sp. RWY-5-1]|uniref:DUF4815 domain-containing protein n=1 Tax=Azospirillum oleiclasticum TaxID=2735135 RepID=A0ABX2T771_9PROT|nr:hypothetical protein [Azospirillum oleiclasticum]NYZ12889.1 hypothetical protein [Azospirillum oleiclasticum]NYZ20049.1 hypothetical protein [Azospirillum oleiclasticum]